MKPAESAATASLAKAYVREMFEMNPMWQSPEIIRRRRELWLGNSSRDSKAAANNESKSPLDPLAQHRLHQRAQRCLDTLQTQFYQLPAEKLQEHLNFLQSDRLPGFAATARQLRRVAQHRQALLEVGQQSGDPKFSYSLQQSLVCSATEAGALREQYIEAIIEERRVPQACQMIRSLTQNQPAIYQLQRDWFDLFLDPANEKLWSKKLTATSTVQSTYRMKPVLFIGLMIVLSLIRVATRVEKRPTSKPARPTPAVVPSNQASDTQRIIDSALSRIRERQANNKRSNETQTNRAPANQRLSKTSKLRISPSTVPAATTSNQGDSNSPRLRRDPPAASRSLEALQESKFIEPFKPMDPSDLPGFNSQPMGPPKDWFPDLGVNDRFWKQENQRIRKQQEEMRQRMKSLRDQLSRPPGLR